MSAPKHPPGHPAHDARHAGRWIVGILTVTVAYFVGTAIHELVQKGRERVAYAISLTAGNPARAPALMRQYGCAGCHTIPGVAGAEGKIGPPLTGMASRMYVGGVALNTPDNLIRWIVNPKAIDPHTAMPAVGVTPDQARDIAAYLYTLR